MADSFSSRLCGLLGRSSLLPEEGLILTRCNSIHMFFMRFSIDVLFLDRHDRVVGLVHDIKPFELSPVFWTAVKAIELPSGLLRSAGVAQQDVIIIEQTTHA